MPQGYDLGPVAGELAGNEAFDPEPLPQESAYPGTPPWVKVFAAIALAGLVIFAVMHLTGRGLGGHMHASPSASPARP